MNKSDWFLFLVVCFMFGIVFGEYYLEEEVKKGFIVFVMWVFAVRTFVLIFKVRFVKLIVFGILFVLLGFWRFAYSFEGGEGHVRNFEGWYEFEGCVVEEADIRVDKAKYVVEVERLNLDEKWVKVGGRVLVNGSKYPIYSYGDCLRVSGTIEEPEAIEDFAYDKYLSRYSIYSVVYRANIEKISDGSGGMLYGSIFNLKRIFEGKLNKIFTEPYGGFMAGLILGSRKGISEDLMNSFNMTGLTHIIAVSGYNVALVVVVISGIFSFFTRKVRVVLSIFFIFLFVILVGASASVVRAGIMGGISLIALYFGRQYFVFLSLFASAFFMNMWNPKILVYDVGFQLSFLATFGIVLFSESLGRYLKRVPKILGIREALQLTLSAQITVVPIIILNFERFSIISPIANLFVLPLIPFAMMFGFVAVFFGKIFGFFGYLILEIIIFFVEIFASLEFASLEMKWTWGIGAVYYFLLAKFCISKFCLSSPSSE
ncbi:MAG: ComEC/Rec2 family competence protein [Nitrospirota bacterium]